MLDLVNTRVCRDGEIVDLLDRLDISRAAVVGCSMGGYVLFETHNSIDSAKVLTMLQKQPREYRLEGPMKLRVSRPLAKEADRFAFARELLQRLAAK